jgi:micrococcal nuclease
MRGFRIKSARERGARRKRGRVIKSGLLILLLLLVGGLLDPALVPPFGPTATRPERITASFTRCGQGHSLACVVDGDTIRLGQRRVRLIGIDAPELHDAGCPSELALANRAADRLLTLVNAGPFDLVGHRFQDRDVHGRDLRVALRDGRSLGGMLVDEGLARRYYGSKRPWC